MCDHILKHNALLFIFYLLNQIITTIGSSLEQCLNQGHEIHAWYDGASIDIANNLWRDKSGNNNTGIINDNTGIELFDGTNTFNSELYLNGQPIVTGTKKQ